MWGAVGGRVEVLRPPPALYLVPHDTAAVLKSKLTALPARAVFAVQLALENLVVSVKFAVTTCGGSLLKKYAAPRRLLPSNGSDAMMWFWTIWTS